MTLTDCSLSVPDQWTGRKKRQEKFDIKAENQNIAQVLRLNPRGQSSFKRVIGFIRQLLNKDEPPQHWSSSEPKGLSFSCLILWLMVQLNSWSQLTIFQGWVHLAENVMARVAPFILGKDSLNLYYCYFRITKLIEIQKRKKVLHILCIQSHTPNKALHMLLHYSNVPKVPRLGEPSWF